MPRPKRDELKAGIFVVAALAITLAVILWLGAGEVFRTSGQKVVFYIPADCPGAGVEKGSAIKINDAEVGQIKSIQYRPDLERTLYFGHLTDKDIVLHADGKAEAVSGLLGGASLAIISTGSHGAPLADADNPVRITGGMEQAISDLSASMATLRKTLETELDADNPKSLLRQVHTVLDNLAAISEHLAAETNVELPDSLLSKLHICMDEIGALVPALIASAEKLSGMLAGGSEVIAKLNAGEGTLGLLVNDPRLYEGILDSVAEMGMLLEDIRKALSGWKTAGIPLKLK